MLSLTVAVRTSPPSIPRTVMVYSPGDVLEGTVTEKFDPAAYSLELREESLKLNVAPESAGLIDCTERLMGLPNPPKGLTVIREALLVATCVPAMVTKISPDETRLNSGTGGGGGKGVTFTRTLSEASPPPPIQETVNVVL